MLFFKIPIFALWSQNVLCVLVVKKIYNKNSKKKGDLIICYYINIIYFSM